MSVTLFREHLARKHRHYISEETCPTCHQSPCVCNQQQAEEEDRQAEYRKYFDGMLKKHGYDSPKDIPDDKKKAFFNAVDKGWQSSDEKNESAADDDVKTLTKESSDFGFEKGTTVVVKPTASYLKKTYPAANWIQHETKVKLLDYAPHENTLDVVDVKLPNGKEESIYDFNIVRKA